MAIEKQMWSTTHGCFAAFLFVLGMAMAYPSFSVAQSKASDNSPDLLSPPSIQQLIRDANQSATEDEFRERLEALKTAVGERYEELIPQLLYYSTNAEGMKEAMFMGVVIEQLNISQGDVVKSLLPYLGTSKSSLREAVENILGEVEDESANRPPDFSCYEGLLEYHSRHKSEPPSSLLAYIFRRSPGTALLTCMRVYLRDDPSKTWKPVNAGRIVWRRAVEKRSARIGEG